MGGGGARARRATLDESTLDEKVRLSTTQLGRLSPVHSEHRPNRAPTSRVVTGVFATSFPVDRRVPDIRVRVFGTSEGVQRAWGKVVTQPIAKSDNFPGREIRLDPSHVHVSSQPAPVRSRHDGHCCGAKHSARSHRTTEPTNLRFRDDERLLRQPHCLPRTVQVQRLRCAPPRENKIPTLAPASLLLRQRHRRAFPRRPRWFPPSRDLTPTLRPSPTNQARCVRRGSSPRGSCPWRGRSPCRAGTATNPRRTRRRTIVASRSTGTRSSKEERFATRAPRCTSPSRVPRRRDRRRPSATVPARHAERARDASPSGLSTATTATFA